MLSSLIVRHRCSDQDCHFSSCAAVSRFTVTDQTQQAAGGHRSAARIVIARTGAKQKLVQHPTTSAGAAVSTSANRSHHIETSYRLVCGGTGAGGLAAVVRCPASQISKSAACVKRPWLLPAAISRAAMGCTGSKPMVASSYDGKAHQAQGNGHLPGGEDRDHGLS